MNSKEKTVLDLLKRHGPMFAARIARRSDGELRSDNVRPVLYGLEDKGYVEPLLRVEPEGTKKFFRITEDGEKSCPGKLSSPEDPFCLKNRYLRGFFVDGMSEKSVMVYRTEQMILTLLHMNGPLSILEMAWISKGVVSRSTLSRSAYKMISKGYITTPKLAKLSDESYYTIKALGIRILHETQKQSRKDMDQ